MSGDEAERGAERRDDKRIILYIDKKMASRWLAHVKATMKANKGMKLKDVLKKAAASYKKK